jgi:hypothetical protein
MWVHHGRELQQILNVNIHWSEMVYNILQPDVRQARQVQVVRQEDDETRSSGWTKRGLRSLARRQDLGTSFGRYRARALTDVKHLPLVLCTVLHLKLPAKPTSSYAKISRSSHENAQSLLRI